MGMETVGFLMIAHRTSPAELARQARIAVLLVPGIGTMADLQAARDAGASVARIATHCTEADVSVQHFGIARDMGMETVGFLMMAHMQPPAALATQARLMESYGANCVYCTDSAGITAIGSRARTLRSTRRSTA